jgi:putative ABC transport system ATP-binding protein
MMKTKNSVISLKNIVKDYVTDEVVTHVLFGISLEIKQGEFVAIIGPSGSGKSTFLNIVGLLDNATTGTYILDGKDVTQLTENEQARIRNKEIGFVFQQFNLLKRITVIENVILPSIYSGTPKGEREARAIELLTKVGLAEQMYKRPNQLSGGQQQRVAIARALMNNPAIILADEPTGNLDTKSGNEIMAILKDLNQQGNTIVMITHEKDIAEQAKRRIGIRDGKLF